MATPAVIEHHTINPDDNDLETLLIEHRHWRARLREAMENNRRLRAHAAAFPTVLSTRAFYFCLNCGKSFERPLQRQKPRPSEHEPT